MAVIRTHKTGNYTVMSNSHLRDSNMSLKAKGLMSVVLSLPDNWEYSVEGLTAICKESDTSINSTLRELKKFGYLKVSKEHSKDTGRFEYVYDFFEKPSSPKVDLPAVENPAVENPAVENRGQINTNKVNTDLLSKEDKKDIVKETLTADISSIVNYLNLKADTNYRASGAKTKSLITARMNEGFTVADFTTVIDKKVEEWKGTNLEQYLRPETLFGTKFESYLNGKVNKSAPTSVSNPFLQHRKKQITGTERNLDYTDLEKYLVMDFDDLGDEADDSR